MFKRQIQPVADGLSDRLRNSDTTWRSDALQASCNINAVTIDIVTLDNDIAQIYTHSELNAVVRLCCAGAVADAALHFNCAGHSADYTGKFSKDAVAGQLHDAALMLGNFGVDQLTSQRLECV